MSKLLFIAIFVSAPAFAGSVYDHINTLAFKHGAVNSYLSAIAANANRTNIINTAKDECGGRYEGTEVAIVELSHAIETNKTVVHTANPKDYTLKYDVSSVNQWLVVETIKCSFHGGHYRSVLHSSLVSGTEKAVVSYVYVNDDQVGTETVSNNSMVFGLGADQQTDQYKTPYGTVVN